MLAPTALEVEAEQLRRSFRRFVEAAWDQIEPGTAFVGGYHLEVAIDVLEAVSSGELTRVIINLPPRHGKSSLVSVLWLPWLWITRPELRWIVGSYSQEFASRDSARSRRIIESRWYQERFGDRYQLSKDQNTKLRFENDCTGVRLASSIAGRATGEGADIIVLDDPHKGTDAYSAAARSAVTSWFHGTIATRLNDQKTGAIVVVCQRLHEADLCGVLLHEGGWNHVCLPAEYEPNHPFLYPDDPRTDPGEPLWPAKIDSDALKQMKKLMTPFDVAGQLQQRPSPGGGGIFDPTWWQWFDPDGRLPRFEEICVSWDLALSDSQTADYSVGQVWARDGEDRYLLRSVRDRFSFPDLLDAVKDLNEWVVRTYRRRYAPSVLVEKAANGYALHQTLRNEIPSLVLIRPRDTKVERAYAHVPLIRAGHVFLPGAASAAGAGYDPSRTPAWVAEFLHETEAFPRSTNDDQVDAMTLALSNLTGPRLWILDGT
jgi:predicted phage terminase large subunit-like protein